MRRAGPRAASASCSRACARASEVEDSFERGAVAVLGWPIDEPVGKGSGKTVAAGPAGHRRADQPRRPRGADRPARGGAEERPDAGLQAAALHQLAGLRAARRDQLVPPRHHDARLPEAQALAGAAAGLGQQGREHEAGDVRRGAPRPADGRAGALGRRRADAQRDVHLRRVLAARPHDGPALRPAAEEHPGAGGRVRGAGARQRAATGPTCELVRAVEQESLFDIRDAAEALMLVGGRDQPRAAARAGRGAPARVSVA